jgi:hypothetical protein
VSLPNSDLRSSYFVCDSAAQDDSEGGVDRKYASNVGIVFYSPEEYFGRSNQEMRQQQIQDLDATAAAPKNEALGTRLPNNYPHE